LAPRPLPLHGLRAAVAIATKHRSSGVESIGKVVCIGSFRLTAQAFFDICGTIVDHNEDSGVIRLLHHTAREFLDRCAR